jgi:hypothetical protein
MSIERDFYVKWFVENARMAAQADNKPFDPEKEEAYVRSPQWRMYGAFANDPGAFVLGLSCFI